MKRVVQVVVVVVVGGGGEGGGGGVGGVGGAGATVVIVPTTCNKIFSERGNGAALKQIGCWASSNEPLPSRINTYEYYDSIKDLVLFIRNSFFGFPDTHIHHF